MTKTKAALIHLAMSIAIFLVFLATAMLVWYPDFYFFASDTQLAIWTMTFVDVGLGPLLTFIVYKKGKKTLKFDLSVIVIMQVIALTWGAWVLHNQRPVLTVFHDGMFYCLNNEFAQLAEVDMSQFTNSKELIAQAFLPRPETEEEAKTRRTKIEALIEKGKDAPPSYLSFIPWEKLRSMIEMLSKEDKRPPYPAFVFGKQFEPINESNLDSLLADEWGIAGAVKNNIDYQNEWAKFVQRYKNPQNYAFYPLVCSPVDYLAVVERSSGTIVAGLPFSFIQAQRKKFLAPPKTSEDVDVIEELVLPDLPEELQKRDNPHLNEMLDLDAK